MAAGDDFVDASPPGGGTSLPSKARVAPGQGGGEQENLLEALRAARMVSFEWDLASDAVVRSANAEEIFGPEATRDTGQAFLSRVHAGDRAGLTQAARALTPARPDYTALYRYVRPSDGKELVLEESGRAEFDGAGKLLRLRGLARDVTERRRAEEALRRSEEKYRSLFNSVDEGFCVIEVLFDAEGRAQDYRFIEVNPAFIKQTGLADAVGKTMRQLVPRHDAHWFEIYGRIARTGEPVRFEYPAVAMGRYYDVFAFRIGQPHEHKVALMFKDVLKRKRAEEALERTRTMLMDGERIAHMGTWQWNAETGETVWSEGEFRLYGLEPGPHSPSYADLMTQHFHPEDAARLDRVFQAAIQSGSVFENDHRIVLPGGTVRFVHNRAHPQFDAKGKLVGYVGATLDITERKAFEAELQRLVDERTARLQELVGELEHFSYTITHDLKSPLRAMRGYAQMASRGAEGTQVKELLGRIATSAERMDRLIADALSYSRSVRQELPLEDVDAGALLRGMLDSYPEFQPNRAQIQVEGRLPVVRANEAGLTQCFSNLLGNAVKFVKPGEKPEIRVRATERGEWVRIWVEDKGIGISSDLLPRVFDMFSRGGKEYEGTGIGLALVRKVAQRMGGKAGVESEEGQGSRFWIELKRGEKRPAFAEVGARQGKAPGAG